MLQNTFCHIPGIGPKTERRLWETGVVDWSAALAQASLPLSAPRLRTFRLAIRESADRLAVHDAHYFYARLPSRDHWRTYPHFRDAIAYVDIETTGLGSPGDYITTIALYDGVDVRTYVRGQNLEDFARDVSRYRVLVTYNGKCFDVPFIRADLGVPMEHAHLDLRYVLSALGYRGGLKRCEAQLGIDRGDLVDVDGYFAVILWREYERTRNEAALETLLAYNVLDVLNLETLLTLAYNQNLAGTPFASSHALALPEQPGNPFRADRATIYRLRAAHARPLW
ncbi:MAG: ribonuclease H-like domain-containing protein [Anaerolineae bacterium]|nr:ribonuclease H-like domain-containing protein [Anaerolineae bacterium]